MATASGCGTQTVRRAKWTSLTSRARASSPRGWRGSSSEDVWIAEGGEIAWRNEIDLCRHALYLRLTGKTPEQVFPSLRPKAHA